jgi:hypothetical protein
VCSYSLTHFLFQLGNLGSFNLFARAHSSYRRVSGGKGVLSRIDKTLSLCWDSFRQSTWFSTLHMLGSDSELAAAMKMCRALFLVFNSKTDPYGCKTVLTKESFHGILYLYVKEGVNEMWIVSHKLAFPLCAFFLCHVGFTGKRVQYLVEVVPMGIGSRKDKPKGMAYPCSPLAVPAL